MAKNSFLEWDTNANNDTDVGGVNIAEGCAPSGINNSIRNIMAQLAAGIDGRRAYAAKNTNYTAVANDNNGYLRFTAAATLSLTAAATLCAKTGFWSVFVQADGGDVVVDPNGTEQINGATTITIRNGEAALIICSGTAFFARINTANVYPSYVVKTGNYTALDTDFQASIRFTSAATLAFDTTVNLRTNWRIEVWNDSTGLVPIDPASTDTINGTATLILQPGQRAEIFKTGTTTFQAIVFGDPLSGPQNQGFYFGLGLSTNGTDAANDIDIAVGSAAADVSPYYLMQLTSALTKRIDAAWAVGNNQGGLDTGSVANSTYYIWLIQRSDTGVVDALFSLSSTAPTMPTNYDRKRLIGRLARSASTNGDPGSAFKVGMSFIGSFALGGTATDIISLPANLNRLTILIPALTVSASAQTFLKIGPSGGVVSTGYDSITAAISTASAAAAVLSTTSLLLTQIANVGPFDVTITLNRAVPGSNAFSVMATIKAPTFINLVKGTITLAGDLSRLQIGSVAGTSTLGGTASIYGEY